MKQIFFKDLYSYLDKKCNFRKEKIDGKIQTIWNCKGFNFSKDFCKENKLNWNAIKYILESNGGFCDCEVLFNVSATISPRVSLGWKE